MVFTPPSVVNLFRLSDPSPHSVGFADPTSVTISYTQDFIPTILSRTIQKEEFPLLSQRLVLSGKQAAHPQWHTPCHGEEGTAKGETP